MSGSTQRSDSERDLRSENQALLAQKSAIAIIFVLSSLIFFQDVRMPDSNASFEKEHLSYGFSEKNLFT